MRSQTIKSKPRVVAGKSSIDSSVKTKKDRMSCLKRFFQPISTRFSSWLRVDRKDVSSIGKKNIYLNYYYIFPHNNALAKVIGKQLVLNLCARQKRNTHTHSMKLVWCLRMKMVILWKINRTHSHVWIVGFRLSKREWLIMHTERETRNAFFLPGKH